MSSNDTLKNIIGVALGVCLVCSVLVSTAYVVLRPRQIANQIKEKRKNVLIAGNLLQEGKSIKEIFADKIKPVLIDMKTGAILPEDEMTGLLAPAAFDVKKVAKTPELSRKLEGKKDIARIRRVPTRMLLYYVKDGDGFSQIIFPVHGSGLWSIMYGFISLDIDLKTVRGMTFYDHGETPGLGGEITNPKWLALWKDKIAFDAADKLQLEVIKSVAPPGSTTQIDGLSGATLTTRGVDNMVKFWFGEQGYGPFLAKLKSEKSGTGNEQGDIGGGQ